MLEVIFLCFAIVPMSYGSPMDNVGAKANSSVIEPNKIVKVNSTKITLASEGGAILPNTPLLSLPKENQSFLMTSPADISSNKVKPRKGAPLEGIENISIEQKTINGVNQHVKDEAIAVKNNTKYTTNTNSSTPQPTVKKPPIVSVELIEKADLLNSDPAVDDVDERKIRIHNTNSNGHPGMITPIIITVLVVPIFAMIGYMAIKRGQEAWKNRHYKRMDFLLDGMYND